MSKNPGTAGQRWRMSTIIAVEVQGQRVHISLSCGHEHFYVPMCGTPEESALRTRERIGKSTACSVCSVAKGSEAGV